MGLVAITLTTFPKKCDIDDRFLKQVFKFAKKVHFMRWQALQLKNLNSRNYC